MDEWDIFDSNDFNQSIMDDISTYVETYLTGQTAVSTWNLDESSIFEDLFNETNQPNIVADAITNLSESSQGSEVVQPQLFDINYDDAIDFLATIPTNNPLPIEGSSSKSSVVKSSDSNQTITFMSSSGYCYTNASLQLTIPPLHYQRARRESELEKIIRYLFVPNNAVITLMVSNLLSVIAPHMSSFLRITRLTKPYGPEQLVFYHPYPLWLKDQNGQVYNNSLYLPINDRSMTIEKLAFERLLQNALEKIKQFSIFTSNKLIFDGFHSINASKKKDIIKEYELRYSILHFQVCVVDQNNTIYPTDLQCQTDPIYEYEATELDSLPPFVRQMGKQSKKRKAIGQLKASKKTKMFEHQACG